MNTETVHMYSISVTRKCATFPTLTGRVWSWVMSSFSLLLVCSQMGVLLSLLTESDFSTCTSHTDCGSGLFCDIANEYFIEPRCTDCQKVFDVDMNVVDKNQCSVIIPGWQSIDEVEENVIWFDQ